MSQSDIDQRISELKRRVEIIEQQVGVNSLAHADQDQLSSKAIMDALVQIKAMKDQALAKNKSIDVYLKDHSSPY